jgi:Transposase DDE domain
VAGVSGGASLQQTDRLVAHHYRSAFPQLGSDPPWVARWQSLAAQSSALLRAATPIPEQSPAFYLIDAKPLPVCHRLRQGRVRLLREDGADWGQTSQGGFFGFQLQVLRPIGGPMVNLILTPGHGDDRAPGLALRDGVEGGVTLGARGQQRAAQWAEEAAMLVWTRADAPEHKCLLAQVRQAIETSFSPLWCQFLDRGFARSWPG